MMNSGSICVMRTAGRMETQNLGNFSKPVEDLDFS